MDVYFYEAFEEEVAALRRYLPAKISVGFSDKTIQEAGDWEPVAPLISIRTQSIVPPAWAVKVRGIVSRTTGYDHPQSWTENPLRLPAALSAAAPWRSRRSYWQ